MIFSLLLAAFSIAKGVDITHLSDPLTTLTYKNWTEINGSVAIVNDELCPANNANNCLKLTGTLTQNASIVLVYYVNSNYYISNNWVISMDITSIPDRSNKKLFFEYQCYVICGTSTTISTRDGPTTTYISNSTQSQNIIFEISSCDTELCNLFAMAFRISEIYNFRNQYSTGTFINNFEIKTLEFEPEFEPELSGYDFDVSTCNGNISSLSNNVSTPMNTLSGEIFKHDNNDKNSSNIEVVIWAAVGYIIVIIAAFLFGVFKSKNSQLLFGVLFLLLQSGIDIMDVGSDAVALAEIRNAKQECGATSCAMHDYKTYGDILSVFLIIGAILTAFEIILCIYMIIIEYGCCNQKQNLNLTINENTQEIQKQTETEEETQKTQTKLKTNFISVIELILTVTKFVGVDLPNIIIYSVLYNESRTKYGTVLSEAVLISYLFTCIDITYAFLMLIFKHSFFNKQCSASCRVGWGITASILCCGWAICAIVLGLAFGLTTTQDWDLNKYTLLLKYQDSSQICYDFRTVGFETGFFNSYVFQETPIYDEIKLFEWNHIQNANIYVSDIFNNFNTSNDPNAIMEFSVNYDVLKTDYDEYGEYVGEYDKYVVSFSDFRIYYGNNSNNYDWIYCDIYFNTATNDNKIREIYNHKSIRGREWGNLITGIERITNNSLSYEMNNVDTSVIFQSDWTKGGCYSITLSCAYDFYPNCGAKKMIINNADYDFCLDICSWD
eukprot:502239_1